MEWIVSEVESGSKLISFLLNHLGEGFSSRFVKKMIEQHACTINGRVEHFASTIVGRGDRICFRGEDSLSQISSKVEPSRILFEDGDLLVYNKPAGITCDEKGILRLWKSSSSLLLVHRLDRETTGALILAKSSAVLDNLVEQFRQFQVKKGYLAIVDGVLSHPQGKVENYLGKKNSYAGQSLWGEVSKEKGLYARTDWERLKTGKNASLVACYPKTGRTHQIRVHMAGMGHPILGDHQYGKTFRCPYRPARVLLHSEWVSFNHPVSGDEVKVLAPLSSEFKKAEEFLLNGK